MSASRLELVDVAPAVNVTEAEYFRLLGYPRGHEPGERPRELEAWARDWYAEHGRPWVYVREAELRRGDGALWLDGVEFRGGQLDGHLRNAGAQRALLVAISAGRECEEHARALWQDGRPDEYFFLEIFGSAVVEDLVASLNGRICALAGDADFVAIPHFSPGYGSWDVADQNRLHALIVAGVARTLPGPLAVLASGMLKPKKSLLAVVGLVPRSTARAGSPPVPCTGCAFAPCNYRRAPYRHAPAAPDAVPVRPAPVTSYTVSMRALQKWAQERVTITREDDGTTEARFRFEGTTCSNMGQPLTFDYRVSLSTTGAGYTILRSDCRPAPDDEGHRAMCSYLSDAEALMDAIAAETPAPGRTLGDALAAARAGSPSGCHCTAEGRAHKWRLALEAIHYALNDPAGASPVAAISVSP
ncbi:MAG TPA: hypothetical protein VHE13_00285 [Opitutus sp.]|nr:hypothetical protein [Opitutus sp.]